VTGRGRPGGCAVVRSACVHITTGAGQGPGGQEGRAPVSRAALRAARPWLGAAGQGGRPPSPTLVWCQNADGADWPANKVPASSRRRPRRGDRGECRPGRRTQRGPAGSHAAEGIRSARLRRRQWAGRGEVRVEVAVRPSATRPDGDSSSVGRPGAHGGRPGNCRWPASGPAEAA
jgi:hypothetical protein